MADLDRLRDEFAAAFAAGQSPDPAEWLARVGADQRQELERRIDQYLMTAPRRAWDAEAYERSLEEEALLQEIEEKPTCPGCKSRVQADWQVCPSCHTRLKKPCIRCSTA